MVKTKFSGWSVAVGAGLACFFMVGWQTTMLVFYPAIVAEGFDLAGLSILFTTSAFATVIGNLFLGPLMKKFSAKTLLVLGVVFCSLMFITLKFSTQLWMFWCAGVFGGIGMALGAFAPASVLISRWFIERRATVVSVVFSAATFGGTVLIPIASAMINNIGWRNSALIVAGLAAVVTIPLIFLLVKNDPASCGQNPLGWENAQKKVQVNVESPGELPGVDPKIAKKIPTFWLMVIGFVMVGISMQGVGNFIAAYWQSTGMSVTASGNMTSFQMFAGSILTILVGFVSEKANPKLLLVVLGAALTVGNVLVGAVGGMGSAVVTMAVVAISVRCIGGVLNGIGPSLVAMTAFGQRSYESVLGPQQAMVSLGAAIATPILGAVIQRAGYSSAFYAAAAISLVGGVCVVASLILSPYQPKKQKASASPEPEASPPVA